MFDNNDAGDYDNNDDDWWIFMIKNCADDDKIYVQGSFWLQWCCWTVDQKIGRCKISGQTPTFLNQHIHREGKNAYFTILYFSENCKNLHRCQFF